MLLWFKNILKITPGFGNPNNQSDVNLSSSPLNTTDTEDDIAGDINLLNEAVEDFNAAVMYYTS